MPSIPPSLPPSYGGSFNPLDKPDSYYANQLHDLWNAWYNNPNVQTATALLDFITANKTKIEEIAAQNPTSMALNAGTVPIDQALSTATTYLNSWIQEETDHPPASIQGVSEMVSDIYNWISYAR